MTSPVSRSPLPWRWIGWLAALLLGVALVSASDLLWRADLAVYDAALPVAAAPSDVVIVAIDDASLAELGPWPWRRALHAALLDRLRQYGARAVALNVLFADPDAASPLGDAALASAMRRGPPTVLPMFADLPAGYHSLRERLPVDVLASAAAGIGHAHVPLDRDGIVRSVYLREGTATAQWRHLAVALLDGVPAAQPSPDAQRPFAACGSHRQDAIGAWRRECRTLIPFLGPPGHFVRLSYVDVLRGAVADDALRGRLVLVGVTAQGIETAYPTPRSGHRVGMPGVELAANVLQGLRSGQVIRPVPPAITVVLSMLPIAFCGLVFLRSSPRRSLLWAASFWLLTAAAGVVALRGFGWWWPPSAALAALLVMYPLWSWSRLEAAQQYLDHEFAQLADLQVPLPGETLPKRVPRFFEDSIDRRVAMAHQATQRLRDLHRLYSDTINGLPDAMVLTDVMGQVVLANPAAAALFGVGDAGMLQGVALDDLLYLHTGAEEARSVALIARAPCTIETTLRPANRHVLLRAVPFFGHDQARLGTIVDLVDISELRVMQAEREDLLRFLSHDMKSPATSLLGLAQMQRDAARALPPLELSSRLDVLAQRMLMLVDSFVALARAESADPRSFEETDLCDAARDAHDEVWAAARARAIDIEVAVDDAPLLVHGDRSLLARAITNLLGNAVKFAPAGSRVRVECRRRSDDAVVRVVDSGPGIEPGKARTLFRSFARRSHRGGADPGGAGLGLAFVRAVAEKHGGRAWLDDNVGAGATFALAVPLREPVANA